MAKKTKVGKQRKDKYYKLAKETGYRSRASFKLIQLNRKFEFLPKSRVLIDLCAAPGGWLQVAQQAMPVSSVIIGVDLVPIKPIPNVITFEGDITTDQCRQALKRQLKTWKADVVLHDGAPNVGQNWLQDAFTQNGLTLSALKLATEMLSKGGWFITKVFRSKDYMSLLWVFRKLFKQVHVTKPQASRNESAEIFVVCQGYLAPDRMDPKFVDPSYVFKDVKDKDKDKETKRNILEIVDKKPKAEGYDDDLPIYNTVKASQFVFCDNHLEVLSKCSEIVFDDEDIENHKLTSEDIKEFCKDIKVLGKAALKSLLNWRKQIRAGIERSSKKDEKKEEVLKEIDEEKEIDEILKEAEDLKLSQLQEMKKKKKKLLKERKKLHDRINLKMIIKDDVPVIEEDHELFNLSQIKNKKDLTKVDEVDLESNVENTESKANDDQEQGFKSTFSSYDRHVKEDPRVEAEPEKEESIYSSDEGLSSDLEFESDSDNENDKEETEAILKGEKNPLMCDLVSRPKKVEDTVEKWFDQDFMEEFEDNDLELDYLAESYEKKEKSSKGETGKKSASKRSLEGETGKKSASKRSHEETEDEPVPEDKDNKTKDNSENSSPKKTADAAPAKKKTKKVKLDPEALALGSMIVQSKKMKRDIIESGYNRYASNDENLPDWFVEDEKKHYKKQLPVTAEMVAEYRQRLKEINTRTVKKVVEAKARKKRRAINRLNKAKKRAEKVTDEPDMTEKEKIDQLKSIYKKAVKKDDHKITYVVAKKGVGKRVARPAGVKGRYKVVDKRMKKDDKKSKMMKKSQKHSKKNNKKGGKVPRGKKN